MITSGSDPASTRTPCGQLIASECDPSVAYSQWVAAEPRFMTLTDVAEILQISASQAYALVHSGDLRAIKVGGRGQWRIEHKEFEAYVQRAYEETEAQLRQSSRSDAASFD